MLSIIGAAMFGMAGAAALTVTAGLVIHTRKLTFSWIDALAAPYDLGCYLADRLWQHRAALSEAEERAAFNGETAEEWMIGEPHPLQGWPCNRTRLTLVKPTCSHEDCRNG